MISQIFENDPWYAATRTVFPNKNKAIKKGTREIFTDSNTGTYKELKPGYSSC